MSFSQNRSKISPLFLNFWFWNPLQMVGKCSKMTDGIGTADTWCQKPTTQPTEPEPMQISLLEIYFGWKVVFRLKHLGLII